MWLTMSMWEYEMAKVLREEKKVNLRKNSPAQMMALTDVRVNRILFENGRLRLPILEFKFWYYDGGSPFRMTTPPPF